MFCIPEKCLCFYEKKWFYVVSAVLNVEPRGSQDEWDSLSNKSSKIALKIRGKYVWATWILRTVQSKKVQCF